MAPASAAQTWVLYCPPAEYSLAGPMRPLDQISHYARYSFYEVTYQSTVEVKKLLVTSHVKWSERPSSQIPSTDWNKMVLTPTVTKHDTNAAANCAKNVDLGGIFI